VQQTQYVEHTEVRCQQNCQMVVDRCGTAQRKHGTTTGCGCGRHTAHCVGGTKLKSLENPQHACICLASRLDTVHGILPHYIVLHQMNFAGRAPADNNQRMLRRVAAAAAASAQPGHALFSPAHNANATSHCACTIKWCMAGPRRCSVCQTNTVTHKRIRLLSESSIHNSSWQ
jgi:hypothetical protein